MNEMNEKKTFSMVGGSYLVGAVVYYLLTSIVFAVLEKINPGFTQSNSATVLSFGLLFCIGYPLMFFLIKRVPTTKIPEKKLGFGMWLVAVLVAYLIMIVCNVIGLAVNAQIGKITGRGIMNPVISVFGQMNPIVQILIVVIAAPIIEELVFRKLIIDRVYKYGEVLAVLTSGLMFGLFHGNFQQFIYAFGVGVFFAFIYIRTGKIVYTMVCHVIINFIGTVPTYLMGDIDIVKIQNYMFTGQIEEYMNYVNSHVAQFALIGIYGMGVMLLALAGFVLAIVFHKKFKFIHRESDLNFKQACNALFCNVGMILFALWWVLNIVIAQLGTSFTGIVMKIIK